MKVVNDNKIPPHIVSINPIFQSYLENNARFVKSNTPYNNTPKMNASKIDFLSLRIKKYNANAINI